MKEVNSKENAKGARALTKSELLNIIFDCLQDKNTTENQKEDPSREFSHKLKVLSFILGNNIPAYTGTEGNKKEIESAIDILIDHDLPLFGYTFFVASNSTFNYNWGYLRDKIERFKEFLKRMNVFVSKMLDDVSDLQKNIHDTKEIHVVFDGLFDFKFKEGMAISNISVMWDNFYKIAKVSNKGYFVTIKSGKTVRFCLYKEYNDDMSLITNMISRTTKTETDNQKSLAK